MTHVEASLGKTRYTAKDDGVGVVAITRYNSEGVKTLHVPRKLLIEYALEALQPKIANLIRSVLL